jgi:hypothetical protein
MFVTDMAGYISRTRSKKLQEKPLEVQNVFGYMPLAKESWSGYIKFSKSEKSGTKKSSTDLRTRDNL